MERAYLAAGAAGGSILAPPSECRLNELRIAAPVGEGVRSSASDPLYLHVRLLPLGQIVHTAVRASSSTEHWKSVGHHMVCASARKQGFHLEHIMRIETARVVDM